LSKTFGPRIQAMAEMTPGYDKANDRLVKAQAALRKAQANPEAARGGKSAELADAEREAREVQAAKDAI
jgi:hypothetical protein